MTGSVDGMTRLVRALGDHENPLALVAAKKDIAYEETEMSIDRSGEYWTGTGAADLDEYLRAVTADNYPADRIVHARCECGHDRFELMVDANEGCARRACTSCRRMRFVCDSEENWSDDSEETVCPCGGKTFEIAVGFSHRDDATVKWITVGGRCTKCGVLGAAVDWKIDYSPTSQLYDQV